MHKIKLIKKILFIFFIFYSQLYLAVANADSENTENKDTEFNFFMGKFDFSDTTKNSFMYGVEHQNEELFNETFLGKVSPITGAFVTAAGASYIYTGVQAEYDLGPFNFTPSFAPGYYSAGGGKDLGHALEFKTEVQLTLDLFDSSHLGMSYNHISNASLGSINPGANSYMFNFLQKF